MSLMATRSQLATLAKELSRNTQQLRERWPDRRGAEFEVKYLDPLQTQMAATFAALEKLERLLLKIRSDCE